MKSVSIFLCKKGSHLLLFALNNKVDMNYKEEVLKVVDTIQEAKEKLTLGNIYLHLRDILVEQRTEQDLGDYWKSWRTRVLKFLLTENIAMEEVEENEKAFFCQLLTETSPAKPAPPPLLSPLQQRQPQQPEQPQQSNTKRGTSTSTSKSAKILSLSDKLAIKDMYMRLSTDNMWTLSSGKKVEQAMMTMALNYDVEHACHSLIIDTEDDAWDAYFTPNELDEIRDHDNNSAAATTTTTLPSLPPSLVEYLATIQSATSPDECRRLVQQQQQIDVDDDDACSWAQLAILGAARLFKKSTKGIINFNDISENDLLVRHFSFISSVFDDSMVDGVSGECASQASKAAMMMMMKNHNKRRYMLFKSGELELGCMEIGREQHVDVSIKELKDGYLKQPKVLKDMLFALSRKKPEVARSLCMVGLTLMGSKLTMMMMDSPCGYVARVKRTTPLYFPNNTMEFALGISKLLTLTYTARLLMEATLKTYSIYVPGPKEICIKLSNGILGTSTTSIISISRQILVCRRFISFTENGNCRHLNPCVHAELQSRKLGWVRLVENGSLFSIWVKLRESGSTPRKWVRLVNVGQGGESGPGW
ncbi:hypothetical protein BCR42DRAFT_496295 [Absidia repens]|uniref:Uncharacterized protein n=1 Tax=Absidia repens TaxID=90262 RepID=A0A1X2I009_9FUNG|nr:hypothetical protein BCR42DRAFT_496295 [Absidia repens]